MFDYWFCYLQGLYVLSAHYRVTFKLILILYLFQLDDPERLPKPLNSEFFRTTQSFARCPSFVNLREVTTRLQIPPGVYCIIPSTFEPNQQGEFILRVFSEKKNNLE
jgi:calpain